MMLLGQLSDCPDICCPGLVGIRLPSREGPDAICHKKAQRYGYLPRNFPDVSCLVDALETNLFSSIMCNPNHVLHQLKPPENITGYYNLRERSHNLTIPLIDNNMLRKNFLYRLMFRDMLH